MWVMSRNKNLKKCAMAHKSNLTAQKLKENGKEMNVKTQFMAC